MTAGGKIVYFTRFDPAVERGGGSRRVLQVLEVLGPDEVEIVSTHRRDWLAEDEGREAPEADATDTLLRILATRGEYFMWSAARRGNAWRLRRIGDLWRRRISGGGRLVLLDDPLYFPDLAEAFFRAATPVVAVCHNIESLVPSNAGPFFRRRLYARETDLLRRCRLVLTISDEETRQLEQNSVAAAYLPYYPPREVERSLLAVRDSRPAKAKADLLLLGSAVNAETKEGMEEVVAHWQSHGAAALGGRLLVAGYGTDRHFSHLDDRGGVRFLGPLSAADLLDRLAGVKGAVCYQRQGGGALTRICEFLIAGVPVLANGPAARSYGTLEGLLRFQTLDEIAAAAGRLDHIGRVEPPPRPAIPSALRDLLAGAEARP